MKIACKSTFSRSPLRGCHFAFAYFDVFFSLQLFFHEIFSHRTRSIILLSRSPLTTRKTSFVFLLVCVETTLCVSTQHAKPKWLLRLNSAHSCKTLAHTKHFQSITIREFCEHNFYFSLTSRVVFSLLRTFSTIQIISSFLFFPIPYKNLFLCIELFSFRIFFFLQTSE